MQDFATIQSMNGVYVDKLIHLFMVYGYNIGLILETWMTSSLETWIFSVILDKLIHLFMDIYGYLWI